MLAAVVLVGLIAFGIFYLWNSLSVRSEEQKHKTDSTLIIDNKIKTGNDSNVVADSRKKLTVNSDVPKIAKSQEINQEFIKSGREPIQKIGSLEPIGHTNGSNSPKPKKKKPEPSAAMGPSAFDLPTEFEKVSAAFRPVVLSPQIRKVRKKSSSTDSNEAKSTENLKPKQLAKARSPMPKY